MHRNTLKQRKREKRRRGTILNVMFLGGGLLFHNFLFLFNNVYIKYDDICSPNTLTNTS